MKVQKLVRMELYRKQAPGSDLNGDALFAVWMTAGGDNRVLRNVMAHGTLPELTLTSCTPH